MKELYEKPDGTESMRDLCAIGDKNWRDYTSDEVNDMTGHLMTYPIHVNPSSLPNPALLTLLAFVSATVQACSQQP